MADVVATHGGGTHVTNECYQLVLCVYVCVSMCVCMYVCMCVWCVYVCAVCVCMCVCGREEDIFLKSCV